MYKVICIDDIPNKCCNSSRVVPVPYFGQICTVVEERLFYGKIYTYILDGFGDDVGFDKYHFAPLSNIDETELIKERQEQCV